MAPKKLVSHTPEILAAAAGIRNIGERYTQSITLTQQKAHGMGKVWGSKPDGEPMEQNYPPQEQILVDVAQTQSQAVTGMAVAMEQYAKELDAISKQSG